MGSAGDMHGAAAGLAATMEAGAPEESGGIMHQQCRRVCQAKKTCNTVCQLAARASRGRRGRRAPMGPASPMCDMPDSSARSGSEYDPETAAANMAQVGVRAAAEPLRRALGEGRARLLRSSGCAQRGSAHAPCAALCCPALQHGVVEPQAPSRTGHTPSTIKKNNGIQ